MWEGGGGGHQWSGAHPNDKLYFWLTVGMAPPREPSSAAGPFLESSSSFPLPFLFHPCWRWRRRRRGRRRRRWRRGGVAAAAVVRFDVKVTKSAEAFPISFRPSVRPSLVRPPSVRPSAVRSFPLPFIAAMCWIQIANFLPFRLLPVEGTRIRGPRT